MDFTKPLVVDGKTYTVLDVNVGLLSVYLGQTMCFTYDTTKREIILPGCDIYPGVVGEVRVGKQITIHGVGAMDDRFKLSEEEIVGFTDITTSILKSIVGFLNARHPYHRSSFCHFVDLCTTTVMRFTREHTVQCDLFYLEDFVEERNGVGYWWYNQTAEGASSLDDATIVASLTVGLIGGSEEPNILEFKYVNQGAKIPFSGIKAVRKAAIRYFNEITNELNKEG